MVIELSGPSKSCSLGVYDYRLRALFSLITVMVINDAAKTEQTDALAMVAPLGWATAL
ncbi:hypothetical protein AB0F91_44680 [Amycolatopsis sp. NPDC023774]|uniref:hypothetical protein n=1 Tax=Amycolatopsis sp. NPDC023774 TaxID=3155015 RepID=UPI0033D675E0